MAVPVQRAEETVAGTVAGADPARPVATVGGRCESGHEEPGARIAEAGNGSPPVRLVTERGALLTRDALAPLDEARTRTARDDLCGELRQRGCLTARYPGHARIVRAGTVLGRASSPDRQRDGDRRHGAAARARPAGARSGPQARGGGDVATRACRPHRPG